VSFSCKTWRRRCFRCFNRSW